MNDTTSNQLRLSFINQELYRNFHFIPVSDKNQPRKCALKGTEEALTHTEHMRIVLRRLAHSQRSLAESVQLPVVLLSFAPAIVYSLNKPVERVIYSKL